MKSFLFILLFLTMQPAYTSESGLRIHSISENNENTTEAYMIKWSDGRVSFQDSTIELPEPLVQGYEKFLGSDTAEIEDNYTPTVLSSEEEAVAMLKRQKKPSPIQFNIQCYNLAHVRAYEEYQRTGLKSHKAFLFFTDSYIRKYRFKWWFHVTPMTYVKVKGKTEARVLDREWGKSPLAVKAWTDRFIHSGAACPQIRKYSEYENNHESNDCYLLPVSMYYWQPYQLIELENEGITKTAFDMGEVRAAYRREF